MPEAGPRIFEDWSLESKGLITKRGRIPLTPASLPIELVPGRLPAPATATATVATATVTAAATTTTTTLLARAGLVDRQSSVRQLRAVKGADRRFRLGLAGHLDKAEAACLTAIAVRGDSGGRYRPVCGESCFKLALCRVKAEVSYVDVQRAPIFTSPSGRYLEPTAGWKSAMRGRN